MPRRLAKAALSGALLAFSFPKFGHGAVAWLALFPLLLALRDPSRGFRVAYIAGVVASIGILYWTALVVVRFGGLSLPVGVVLMVLLCLAVALFPGLFGWMVGRWVARYGPVGLLLAPVAWVTTEILRAHTLYRFSWCLLGYSQHASLPFIQMASWTAVYGVSFLVAAPSAALAYAVAEARPRRFWALGGVGALVLAVWVHGSWTLSQPVPESGRIRVGLVQGNILQDQKWDPALAFENLDTHLNLTRAAASRGARVVVWPESSLPFYYDRTPEVAADIRRLAQQKGIYLVFGNDDVEELPQGGERAWVGAKMITPEGDLAFRYHKVRLVPFGEYVPLQPLLTLGGRYAAKLVRQVADFTPGADYSVGRIEGHGFSVSICYEAIFPDLIREFAAAGAELLVNVTNDGWYGRTSAPYQHFAMAAFRAVENRKYLVRAANTGITAVVDPHGRVTASTALFDRRVLVADVPFVPATTFYTRHGDVFAWSCFGAAFLLTAVAIGAGQR